MHSQMMNMQLSLMDKLCQIQGIEMEDGGGSLANQHRVHISRVKLKPARVSESMQRF